MSFDFSFTTRREREAIIGILQDVYDDLKLSKYPFNGKIDLRSGVHSFRKIIKTRIKKWEDGLERDFNGDSPRF